MTLQEAVEFLNSQSDAAAVVSALHSGAPRIHQGIFDKGFGKAKTEFQVREVALQDQLKAATEDLGKVQGELKEVREKAPDVGKVTEQFQGEIKSLKDKHKQDIDTLRASNLAEKRNRDLATLRAQLAAKLDPEYAKLKSELGETASRLRYNSDGNLEVMQAGKEIPFAPAEGKNPLDLLADEIITSADPKWVVSNVNGGSGVNNSGGNSGGGSGSVYERIRAERAKAEEAKKHTAGTAAERLGMTRTA